jgi:hypothetical protein
LAFLTIRTPSGALEKAEVDGEVHQTSGKSSKLSECPRIRFGGCSRKAAARKRCVRDVERGPTGRYTMINPDKGTGGGMMKQMIPGAPSSWLARRGG